MEEHHISVTKTARYYVLPAKSEEKSVLFALHGYRQLPKYFARQLERLCDFGVKIIVPEGLHRFYVEGHSGRVGASWMTKEDRETDIADYVNYLNDLFDSMKGEIGQAPIHLFGFSQGGATACRWLAGCSIPFKSLILYASVFPNDFDFELQGNRVNNLKCVLAFGDTDEFAPEEIIREKSGKLRRKNIDFELLRFVGGHEIQEDTLEVIWKTVNAN